MGTKSALSPSTIRCVYRGALGISLLLFCISALAQPETLLVADEGNFAQISPDGQFAVFKCLGVADGWCVHDLETGITQEYPLPGGVNYTLDTGAQSRYFSVSNGAEVIAFSGFVVGVQSQLQIYLFHRLSNTVEQITRGAEGLDADGSNVEPVITPDGRYVVFASSANNLHADDNNDLQDVYRYDRQTEAMEWITRDTRDTSEGIGIEDAIDVSDDGKVIAFVTAVPFVTDDFNRSSDAYVWDDGSISRVSVTTGGNEVDEPDVYSLALSGNGNVVAFTSNDDTGGLDPRKTSDRYQVFMRDRTNGTTFMISDTLANEEPICLNSLGNDTNCVDDEQTIAIDFDGDSVVFASEADGLAIDSPSEFGALYVHNFRSDQTTLISFDETGAIIAGLVEDASISTDGVVVAFDHGAVYVRDRGDIFPPVLTPFSTNPSPPELGVAFDLSAVADDTNTGMNIVASAEYRINASAWFAMDAADGSFDEVVEDILANVSGSDLAPGNNEICIRASDEYGNTSGPVCEDIIISEVCDNGIDDDGDGEIDQDDSDCIRPLVRCHHDPIYSVTSGEVFTIKADTIDRNGEELRVDSIEIFLGFDRSEPQEIAIDASSAFLAYPPGGNFSYFCRATNGPYTEVTGWRMVVLEEFPFPAIPVVLQKGPLSEKIDIVFHPDDDEYSSYTDPAFIKDVGLLIAEGFGTAPSFVENQQMFNFWIGKDPGNSSPDPSDDRNLCLREAPDNFNRLYAFADSAGIIHRSRCRDNAGAPGIFTIQMNLDRLQVVVHEAGHRPFGLADEYCCDGGYFTNSVIDTPPFPNLFKTEAGCRNEAGERDFDPDECRELFASGANWWLFEPDYNNFNPEPWDWMQQQGCASYRSNTPACSIQLTADILGPEADPNGVYACSELMEAYQVDTSGGTACAWSLDENMPCLWLCRSPGTATEAEWIPSRGFFDRYDVRASELDRFFWYLGKCQGGKC